MSPTHFADRLADAVRRKGNALCVSLDPRWESLPISLRGAHGADSLEAVAAAFEVFCSRVLDLVEPLAPVVKPQSAFFEMCDPGNRREMAAAPASQLRTALVPRYSGGFSPPTQSDPLVRADRLGRGPPDAYVTPAGN
jgi:orotidine-5'-phosphate decarboxylase